MSLREMVWIDYLVETTQLGKFSDSIFAILELLAHLIDLACWQCIIKYPALQPMLLTLHCFNCVVTEAATVRNNDPFELREDPFRLCTRRLLLSGSATTHG